MRVKQEPGKRGSLRWIQAFVNQWPEALSRAITEGSGGRITGPIRWLSPLLNDDYAEYSDAEFLQLCEMDLQRRTLKSFWPDRGPQWDALGRTADGHVVLVEAKAHIAELVSPGSQAGADSLDLIKASLAETAAFYGVTPTCDWSATFYQYTNRLAHLYLLRELNQVPATLAFVYFLGDSDMRGPQTVPEWKAGLEVLHGALGLPKHIEHVVDVFLTIPNR